MDKALEYFNNNELAAAVWRSKYAQIDEETPDDMHRRMAKEFARVRARKDQSKTEAEWESHIFDLFEGFRKIIPQGRVMAGLGVEESVRALSNCIVLPSPKDSYNSIMAVDAMLVSAAKRGCGYGLDLSNLRPKGAPVSNAANTSTGMASFMERYSFSTREVAQSGRRGACLESIAVEHPDVLDFVLAKSDLTKITGANVSVKLTTEFMEAVGKGGLFLQVWPIDKRESVKSSVDWESLALDTIHEIDGAYVRVVVAEELFKSIAKQARDTAEPGVFFWDRVIQYDPASAYDEFKPICTNACGEQPMAFGDTCRLIVLNLLSTVRKPFQTGARIDHSEIERLSYEMACLGDDLVDLELEYIDRILRKIETDDCEDFEKLPERTLWTRIKDITRRGRRMGCGITGLGDTLASVGIAYDSDEGIATAKAIMKSKMRGELRALIEMAKSYGAFPAWDDSIEFPKNRPANPFYEMLQEEFPDLVSEMREFGRRSINWSTIAPTGSVSILAKAVDSFNISSGCEPQFSLFYTRRRKIDPTMVGARTDFTDQNGDRWMEYPVLMGAFRDYAKLKGFKDPEDMSSEELKALVSTSPWAGCTANEIDWDRRVEMQSVLQRFTTAAISTTLNLPATVTADQVADIYLSSWKRGNKGQTIYRDGSRSGVLVSSIEKFAQRDAPKRPKELPADLYHVTAMGQRWTVCIGLMEDKPYEVFATRGEYGTHQQKGIVRRNKRKHYSFIGGSNIVNSNITAMMSGEEAALTRMISTALRHGTKVDFVIDQLSSAEGPIVSFSKAIARTLKKYAETSVITCSECGSDSIETKEGCLTCNNCGNSKCG